MARIEKNPDPVNLSLFMKLFFEGTNREQNLWGKKYQGLCRGLLIALLLFSPGRVWALEKTQSAQTPSEEAHQEYLNFFEEIYDLMDKNYYQDISRESFDDFIKLFDQKIYKQLKDTGKSIDYIRWRSAALLVDHLKTSEDIFSAFYPPKPAKEYEETALGKRVDLGITGEKVKKGYEITFIEPRSDAYAKGLREKDVILYIGRNKVRKLTEEEIKDLLNPLLGTEVKIVYFDRNKKKHKIRVVSKEYFKQTVFLIPVEMPGVFCLQIERFNKKTAEDLFRYLTFIRSQQMVQGLILDLRNNPGGPPLAAREIASFFLPPGDDFAYFQKRGHPKARLDVPRIPEKYHYRGPMVILINEQSGSASELFSGIMQKRKRAVLIGTQSAGQVMLKSMFHLEDESMLLLITSRGYHPDGSPFSFGGLNPDRLIEDQEIDMVEYAALFFYYLQHKK